MTMDQVERFRALHVPGDPLVLFNIWDAGSARAVAEAGAKAIATGSYGVAEANGFKDGEAVPLEFVLGNLRRILSVTDVPVTIDMEAGYGANSAEVAISVGRARDLGAAGINLEDRHPGTSAPMPLAKAAQRVAAAASTGLHVNARTDVYLGRKPDDFTPELIDMVVERARAYADAGADSLFVPFLGDHPTIAQICERSPLPVNVLWAPGCGALADLAALGVARVSYGHGPWAAAMTWFARQAEAALSGATPPYAD
jgi:2-methylisocitrate lyase-like PEP mutase family enzyme